MKKIFAKNLMLILFGLTLTSVQAKPKQISEADFNELVTSYCGVTAEELKKSGNNLANAQFNKGRQYLSGEGVAQDKTLAFNCFRSAKESGNVMAKYEVATQYINGELTDKEQQDITLQQALDWYQQSAEAGYAPAQQKIGELFQAGELVKQDTPSAMYWLEQAANQGDVEAQYQLVEILFFGKGTLAQPQKAVELMQKYASHAN